jgi:hypothetical protein
MNKEVTRARASPSTLIILEAFTMPLFALYLFLALERHAGWGGFIVVGILCLLIFSWWGSFSVTIDQNTLVYTTFFSSRKEIKLNDISSVVRKTLLKSKGIRPSNRIEVYGNINGQAVEFDINLKVFRIEDVRKIEARLLPGNS